MRGRDWRIEKLVRVDAKDGRVVGETTVEDLVPGEPGCAEVDGHVHCLELRRAGRSSALSRVAGESGASAWSASLPDEIAVGSWWHVFEDALFIEVIDGADEHSLAVLDWTSGRYAGRVQALGRAGVLRGIGGTILFQRRDASLVAYDAARLAALARAR